MGSKQLFSEVLSVRFSREWWGKSRSERKRIIKGLVKRLKDWKIDANAEKGELYVSLRSDSDLIFWFMAVKPESLVKAKLMVGEMIGTFALASHGFMSVYDSHTTKETQRDNIYFVAYPISKDREWYLLDEGERKRVTAQHIRIAVESKNNNGAVSYTTKSFGIGDNEFVVIYELAGIPEWVKVTEELRGAEARRWIRNEAPILLGIRYESGDFF